jgi:hypothetical protein
MTKLTGLEANILEALRSNGEYESSAGWLAVYLDNAYATASRTLRISPHSWAGVLSSLERKGLYKTEDGYAWGYVKDEDEGAEDEVENMRSAVAALRPKVARK